MTFSVSHNNVRGLERTFEKLHTHLLNELDYQLHVIGIAETRITVSKLLEHLPSLSVYELEFVPAPLSAGGVGMFTDNILKYRVREKPSSDAFQALWIKVFEKNKKIFVELYIDNITPLRVFRFIWMRR